MPKILLIASIIAISILHQSVNASTLREKIPLGGDRSVTVEYGNKIVYGRLPTGPYESRDNISVTDVVHFFKIHAEKVVKNKLVQVKGKAYTVVYESLNSSIAEVTNTGKISWKEKGKVTFQISVIDQKNKRMANKEINVEVILVPIGDFMDTDEVVERIGFPDRETETYWEWYKTAGEFEGISYQFSNNKGMKIQHWSYNKYPGLKIRIHNSNKAVGLSTTGWDSGYANELILLD